MTINRHVFELVVFIASLGAFVGLQISGHSSVEINDALMALAGTALGHGLSGIKDGAPVVHVNLPENGVEKA